VLRILGQEADLSILRCVLLLALEFVADFRYPFTLHNMRCLAALPKLGVVVSYNVASGGKKHVWQFDLAVSRIVCPALSDKASVAGSDSGFIVMVACQRKVLS
jgi:hypothetical protein